MKKLIKIMLTALLCIALLAMLFACRKNPGDNSQDPSNDSSDISSESSTGGSGEESSDIGHECIFGEWQRIKDPSYTETGLEQRTCTLEGCQNSESREIPMLVAAYYITIKDAGVEKIIPVLTDGAYSLPDPSGKVGYVFAGYKTEAGADFAKTGTISASITVIAEYTILPTTTFAELKERIEGGAEAILLAADITLTDTIYVVDDTLIYSNESHTLVRGNSFLGDLFILGCDAEGFNVTLKHKRATLSIKPEGDAIIKIDGNKSSVTGNVSGTAFFLKNSAVLNVYDGVQIVNMKKTANSYLLSDGHNISGPELVGGPVAIIANGEFNMYGGLISNCEANMNDSAVTPSADQVDGYDNSSRGGAIFNYGTFNMYGGKIENCKAGRGGALYNYRVMNLVSGQISGNYTPSYGGVVYLPNSQYVYAVVGDEAGGGQMLISQNSADKSGGAMYVAHMSAVYIKETAKFLENETKSNGGAINCAGTVILEGGAFEGNKAASKGGAIYAYYDKPANTRRIIELRSGSFVNNEAPRGGAVALGKGGADIGAHVRVGDVIFEGNRAPLNSSSEYGFGGAIHADNASLFEVYGNAIFKNNSAASNGGAVYATKNSTVSIVAQQNIRVLFQGNSAAKNGGVIYNSGSTVTLNAMGGRLDILGNTASDCGGAFAVHSSGTTKLYGIYAKSNSAVADGGVLYVHGANAVIGDSATPAKSFFIENTAERGGAIFIDTSKSVGADLDAYAVELIDNSSTAGGGALYASVYSDEYPDLPCTVDIGYLKATGNSSGGNGGALYIYTYVKANIGTLIATGNTADGNYGGAIYIYGKAEMTVNTINATSNTASKGGCIYLTTTDTTLTLNGGEISGNVATTDGGGDVLWSNSAGSVLRIKTDASDNYLLVFDEAEVLGKSGFAITKFVEEA